MEGKILYCEIMSLIRIKRSRRGGSGWTPHLHIPFSMAAIEVEKKPSVERAKVSGRVNKFNLAYNLIRVDLR